MLFRSSFLFNKYDISYDNKYVDKLKAFTIIFKDQLKLISKENYEKIREESSLKYYEIIEDYIEENRIFILTEDFISLLDLIRITTNIFNRKISKDMLDDFIFEYNLNYDEVTFLNNWIVINKITILENSKFPFDQLSSTDYLEIYKEDENIFLIKIYQNLYKFIPGFNKNSIFQIKRLFDLYFKYFKDNKEVLERIEIYSLKIVIENVVKYSTKKNYLFFLKKGVQILENCIKKYDLNKFNNSVSFTNILMYNIKNEFNRLLVNSSI